MIGPAFISAPDSASPQSSITPGNARPITSSAWSCSRSGSTPVGSRLARMVIATSNGPCLRVSHGSVPVSAKLTSARLPASRVALAKMIEPNVPGGRNTTWPSREMRRERARDVGLRGRRSGAEDQFGTAHGLGDVGRDQRKLRLVPPAEILHDDARAGRADAPRPAARRAATAARRALQARNRPPPRTSRCRRRAPRSSSESPCAASRVKLLQHEMLHLAERVARQIVDEHDVARHLEARELRQQMRLQAPPPRRRVRRAGPRRRPAPPAIADPARPITPLRRHPDAPAARARPRPDRCSRRRR